MTQDYDFDFIHCDDTISPSLSADSLTTTSCSTSSPLSLSPIHTQPSLTVSLVMSGGEEEDVIRKKPRQNKGNTSQTLRVMHKVLYPSATVMPTVYQRPSRRKKRVARSSSDDEDDMDREGETAVLPPSSSSVFIVIPRILKSDIRRQYARMFANVMNSNDSDLMTSFLHRYANREVRMDKLMVPNSMTTSKGVLLTPADGVEPSNPCDVRVRGIDRVAQYFQMTLAPDQVYILEDTKIITKPDSMSCVVRSKYRAKGTLLIDLTVGDAMTHVSELLSKTFADGKDEQSMTNSPLMSMETLLKYLSARYGPAILGKTTEFVVCGELTVFIDEQKRIDKFEMKSIPSDHMFVTSSSSI